MKKFLVGLMFLSVMFFSVSELPLYAEGGLKAYNTTVTMTSANTEYDWTIPNGTMAITIQCRGSYDVKLSFTNGASGTTYYTIKSGCTYYETTVSAFNNSLHVQCATASQILEIIYWI